MLIERLTPNKPRSIMLCLPEGACDLLLREAGVSLRYQPLLRRSIMPNYSPRWGTSITVRFPSSYFAFRKLAEVLRIWRVEIDLQLLPGTEPHQMRITDATD